MLRMHDRRGASPPYPYTACMSIAHTWNTTPDERARAYPCDGIIVGKTTALYRAIDVDAPPSLAFRWLCQLRAAPYSYDWIDNGGRRSPQALRPGLEDLRVSQPIMRIFDLISFERDAHITVVLRNRGFSRHIFGHLAATYAVIPISDTTSRIVVKIAVRYPPPPHGWFVRLLLPWGDWIMMRKQFQNLKRLAERDARRRGGGGRTDRKHDQSSRLLPR